MRITIRFELLLAASALLLGVTSLTSQELPAPSFRMRDARARAARVLDSVARVDRATRATRYVESDTTRGGVTWIQFEPTAIPRSASARTPEEAATSLLALYAAPVFGVHPQVGSLELRRVHEDGHLRHLRYAQRHAGYDVLHGQLIVHVIQVAGGYVVQAANGWLFPEIEAPIAPSLGWNDAENAALVGLRGAAWTTEDTAPVVVPHGEGYRLAYLIPVRDSSRDMPVARYVDAATGVVFAESPAVQSLDASPRSGVVPSARSSKVARPSRSTRSTAAFVTARGLDYFEDSQDFVVWDNGTAYELRDNSHAGASEIRIHSLDGVSLFDSCGSNRPIVQQSDNDPWIETDFGKEEVSAVHNLGVAVSDFKTKFGRNGMANNSAVLKACVHGSNDNWNALYSSTAGGRLSFRSAMFGDGPSVAPLDVATHEFTHGVTHTEVTFNTADFGPRSVNEGLADYFGARTRGNERCHGKDAYLGHAHACVRYLHADSIAWCGGSAHCFGIKLSSALLSATETNSGYFATETDWNVYGAIGSYMTSTMDAYEAAHAIVARARIQEHWGGLAGASAELETRFLNNGLQNHYPVTVQMSGTSTWTLTINNLYYVYDIAFEVGQYGLNADGSVAPPDSPIDVIVLREEHYYDAPITFGQDETEWHSCGDGHAHSFKVTLHTDYGPLTYYGGQHGCGGSLMAGPATADALPTKFAVRQAIQTSDGIVSASIVGSGGQRGSLGAQVRQHGITALEIDIPVNTAPSPIEMTVFNPQGRVVRRIVTAPVGPGTERLPWDRKNDRGEQAPAGVYVVLVHHGSYRHRTHFIIPAER